MTAIADVWPLMLVAACGFVAYAILRLTRRFSPGALNAGPKAPPDAVHHGQSDLADDLRRIERRLDTRPDSLIRRIEQSCQQLGVATDDLGSSGGVARPADQHIDLLLDRLEAHLDLPPIVAAAPSGGASPSPASEPGSSFTRSTRS